MDMVSLCVHFGFVMLSFDGEIIAVVQSRRSHLYYSGPLNFHNQVITTLNYYLSEAASMEFSFAQRPFCFTIVMVEYLPNLIVLI